MKEVYKVLGFEESQMPLKTLFLVGFWENERGQEQKIAFLIGYPYLK